MDQEMFGILVTQRSWPAFCKVFLNLYLSADHHTCIGQFRLVMWGGFIWLGQLKSIHCKTGTGMQGCTWNISQRHGWWGSIIDKHCHADVCCKQVERFFGSKFWRVPENQGDFQGFLFFTKVAYVTWGEPDDAKNIPYQIFSDQFWLLDFLRL